MSELFSILIANYNRSEFLEDCIKSIINQTYTNWEVIFVDDCSTDESINQYKKLTKGDSRFKLFANEKNEGCGYTKKKCIDLANGSICGFLDSDDTLAPDALSLMVEAHNSYPDVSIFSSRKASCDEKLKIYDVETSISYYKTSFKSQLDNNFSISHFATFKKNAYLNSPGINPLLKKAVDQDLYYKLEEQGKVGFINKVLYYYRHSKSSISLFSNSYKADAWHLIVIYDTCRRRNLNFDDYCSLMKKTKSRKEKLINLLFYPYQTIKEKLKMNRNLSNYKKENKTNAPEIIIP